MLATTTLTPEPIPLDLKVVLIGDLQTYYALFSLDEQFAKLFKVRADFSSEMNWTAENEQRIVEFIRNRCDEQGLPQFDMGAVAEVVEFSARTVEDQDKLSTRFALVTDLVQEAAFWAARGRHELVTREDVRTALAAQENRSNQYEERMREMITDGTIMVDTAGARSSARSTASPCLTWATMRSANRAGSPRQRSRAGRASSTSSARPA